MTSENSSLPALAYRVADARARFPFDFVMKFSTHSFMLLCYSALSLDRYCSISVPLDTELRHVFFDAGPSSSFLPISTAVSSAIYSISPNVSCFGSRLFSTCTVKTAKRVYCFPTVISILWQPMLASVFQ